MTAHNAAAATCTAAGNDAYYSCDRCNGYFADEAGETPIAENSWIKAAQGHNMTAHDALAATCTTAGNDAYYSCDRCNGYFADAAGETPIAENSWVISSGGHDWKEPVWTWGESSATAEFVCNRDASHTHTETDQEITVTHTAEPSSTAPGTDTWTASVTFEGKEYSDSVQKEVKLTPTLNNTATSTSIPAAMGETVGSRLSLLFGDFQFNETDAGEAAKSFSIVSGGVSLGDDSGSVAEAADVTISVSVTFTPENANYNSITKTYTVTIEQLTVSQNE